jgi:hypothetical protein
MGKCPDLYTRVTERMNTDSPPSVLLAATYSLHTFPYFSPLSHILSLSPRFVIVIVEVTNVGMNE